MDAMHVQKFENKSFKLKLFNILFLSWNSFYEAEANEM